VYDDDESKHCRRVACLHDSSTSLVRASEGHKRKEMNAASPRPRDVKRLEMFVFAHEQNQAIVIC
jgi:hypothetical protein